jgi:hypothetical protein
LVFDELQQIKDRALPLPRVLRPAFFEHVVMLPADRPVVGDGDVRRACVAAQHAALYSAFKE